MRRLPAQAGSGGFAHPPHPRRALAGQRFWPLTGKIRRGFVVTRVDAKKGIAHAQREDGRSERFTVKLPRLLEATAAGKGRWYTMIGFASLERSYRTWAHVVDVGEHTDIATLVVPEWHPSRPVGVAPKFLPPGTAAGAWVACTAVLAAKNPQGLQLDLTEIQTPPDDTLNGPDPAVGPIEPPRAAVATPAIVLDVDPVALPSQHSGSHEWFPAISRLPRDVTVIAGETVIWLADPPGRVQRSARLVDQKMLPNGMLWALELTGDTLNVPIEPAGTPPHHPGRIRVPWWATTAPQLVAAAAD